MVRSIAETRGEVQSTTFQPAAGLLAKPYDIAALSDQWVPFDACDVHLASKAFMTGAAALGRGMVMRSMIRSRTMLDRLLPMAKAASLNRNISVSVSMTNKGTVLLGPRLFCRH